MREIGMPAKGRRWALASALVVASATAGLLWLSASSGQPAGNAAHMRGVGSAADRAASETDPPRRTRSAHANAARPAPSQVPPGRPLRLTLPSGVAMPVDSSATAPDGLLRIPADVNRAGWWDGSSRLGDPFGPIVIAAHIDSFTQGLGRFVELLGMQTGDVVIVKSRHVVQPYAVVSARLVPKAELSASAAVYRPSGPPRLVLITCGGSYAPETGYADNMVVIANPVGPAQRRS